jgi:hypothetical protein
MLEIGVRLPALFDSSGEWLAEAQALEAAGVQSIWLAPHVPDAGELDTWMLLSALALATRQATLVAWMTVPPGRGEMASARTLAELSRGRTLIEAAAAGLAPRPLLEFADPWPESATESVLHGFVHHQTGPGRTKAAFEKLRRRHPDRPALKLWAEIETPVGRTAWREALAACAEAGATGVVVGGDPRLLDLLRNPDAEDDRSDLRLAIG